MDLDKSPEELASEAMKEPGIAAIMKVYEEAQRVLNQTLPYEMALRPQILLDIASDRSG